MTLVTEERGKAGVLQCKLANNINGNVLVHSGKLNTLAPVTPVDSKSGLSVYDFYGQAEEEINTNNHDQKLWEQSLIETGGDPQKTKVRYIKLRANQLYVENGGSVSTAGLNEETDAEATVVEIDISGTYVSERIRRSWTLRNKSRLSITLQQKNNSIVGSFFDSLTGPIQGTINKGEIELEWEAGNCSSGVAKVTVASDGSSLEGVFTCRSQGMNRFDIVFRPI